MTAKTTTFGKARAILDSLSDDKIKELTARGQNLSNAFEQIDPTIEHPDRSCDAFERVLLAAGKVTRSVPAYGVRASTLQDIYDDPKTRLLVPELIARAYRRVAYDPVGVRATLNTSQDATLGSFLNQYAFPPSVRLPRLQAAIPVGELVAVTTGIDRNYYRPFYMNDIADTQNVSPRVAEGAEVPAIEISMGEKQINLKKVGRRIDATYESLRQMPIDLLGYFVQRIGIRVEADKVNNIVAILIAGDGNPNTAATNYTLTSLHAGTPLNVPTLRAYLAFKMKFDNPFTLTHAFARETPMLDLMLLDIGSVNVPRAMAGGVFNQQFTPINQSLGDAVRIGKLNAVPANLILGIDARVAIERVYEIGAEIREVDRWIREQKESLVMTETEGYSVLEPLATKTLQLNA